MDYEGHQSQVIDRLIGTTFGLWNALLTVNGITLGIFAALYAIAPRLGSPFVAVLIACCVISACLLVFNYLAMKHIYYGLGEVMAYPGLLTKERRERDMKHTQRRHIAVTWSERITLVLFVVEVFCIAGFVLTLPPR